MNLRIENEDGELIDKVLIDDQGRFRFAKLDGEEKYIFKIDNQDEELLVGSKIYLVDANDVKTERFVYTEEGVFVNSREIKEEKIINGVFNYDGQPLMKSGIIISDENGFALDTVSTDEKGGFSYSMSKYDEGISVAPLNMTESDLENSDLILLDDSGNTVQNLTPGKYEPLKGIAEDNTVLEIPLNERPVGDKQYTKGMEQEAEAWNGMAVSSRSVYFNFNEQEMPPGEQNKLSLLISILKMGSEMKANLVGHTDNKGSAGFNQRFGLNRAKHVKKYLINQGVSSSQVIISSKGMSFPIADNTTE